MVTWPAALPQEQFLGLSDQRQDSRARTGAEAGPVKMRRRAAAARTVPVPIVMTGAQLQTFNSWFKGSLAEGCLPFTWEDPVTDAIVTFRFGQSTPEFHIAKGGSDLTRLWEGSLELELLPGLVSAAPALLWSATPTADDVGTNWAAYMAANFGSVDTIVPGSIVTGPEGVPALRSHYEIGGLHGVSEVCEMLVPVSTSQRASVTLRYQVYLDPTIDYLAVGGSLTQTIAYLTFPGLIGGQLHPGAHGRAYPVGSEPPDDGWTARIRVAGSGKIAPYLYVPNMPGTFGWHRTSNHPLRINDLRGAWTVWEQTCVMNIPGIADGRCILRINGQTIVDVSDIEYRSDSAPGWVSNGIRLHSSLTDSAPAVVAFDIWFKSFEISSGLPPPSEGVVPLVKTSSDTVRVRLAEVGAVSTAPVKAAADGLAVRTAEAGVVAAAAVAAADILALHVTEADVAAGSVASSDALAVRTTEVGSAAIARAASDALAVRTTEAAAVDTATVVKASSDSLAVHLAETGAVDAVGLGATPQFASVGATTSATAFGTHQIAYPAGVQLGDLLLLPVLARTNANNALLVMHANLSAALWQHLTGSPFEPTTARCLLIAWKLADSGDVAASAAAGNLPGGVVSSGGAGTINIIGHCQRWTAANGWATPTPFESILSVLESNNPSINALTVTPSDDNRRAVSIFGGQAAPASFSFAGEAGGNWAVASHITGSNSCINTQTADLSAGGAISGGSATMSIGAGGPLVAFALAPSGGSGPAPTGPFIVAGFYPEYRSGSHVTHAQVPFAKMDQLYYFAVYPRCHYQASLLTSTDVFTALQHPFTNGQTVQLRNISAAATPSHAGGSLAYDTNYFIRDTVAGVSFKLALTSGGAAIDFTGAGGSDGRCFKAPGSYAHRYEFNPPIDVAAANDLITKRNASNPNCKVFLTLGGANSMADFRDAMNWNGSAVVDDATYPGVSALVTSMLDIIALHGFDGVDVDAELLGVTGVDGLGDDGRYVWALALEFRSQMDTRFGTTPRMPLVIGAFSRSGPANTKEVLAAALVNHVPPLSDHILLPAYGFTFPNPSGLMVLPHNALTAAMDSGITPAVGNDMIETLAQFTDAGCPASKIIYGFQAGGVPWIGGVMTSGAAGNSPSSVGRGARYPGDSWVSGGTAPETTWPDGELLFRDRSDVNTTGTYIVDAAGAFAYIAFTGATPAQDVFCAFDSPETAVVKRAYWEAQGIGGLFLWELGGDEATFSILEAMGPPAGE